MIEVASVEVLDEFIVAGDSHEGFTAFVWCHELGHRPDFYWQEFDGANSVRACQGVLEWVERVHAKIVTEWPRQSARALRERASERASVPGRRKGAKR